MGDHLTLRKVLRRDGGAGRTHPNGLIEQWDMVLSGTRLTLPYSGETGHACALVATLIQNYPVTFIGIQGRDPCGQRHLTSEGLILS